MKIWPFSDIHEEFSLWSPPDPRPDHDIVVIAGDFRSRMRKTPGRIHELGLDTRPVLLIGGNHDPYGRARDHELMRAREAAEAYPNIHVMQDDAVIINGVRFLGATLWTDFCLYGADQRRLALNTALEGMNDFTKIRAKFKDWGRWKPIDAATEHERTIQWMADRFAEPFNGPTVVITHHAPSARSLMTGTENDIISACYASNLDHLIEAWQPTLWIHGHIHEARDYTIGMTRIVCNPRGYVETFRFGPRTVTQSEPTGFDPELIVEIPN